MPGIMADAGDNAGAGEGPVSVMADAGDNSSQPGRAQIRVGSFQEIDNLTRLPVIPHREVLLFPENGEMRRHL